MKDILTMIDTIAMICIGGSIAITMIIGNAEHLPPNMDTAPLLKYGIISLVGYFWIGSRVVNLREKRNE